MSRKPPVRYFVGLNWESYKARLMTVLTTDAWAMALAAVIAILLSHTTLTLALRVSTVSARHCACVVILSSFALGFGLWTTNFIQVLSLWLPERPSVGLSWFVLPFAVAASSQACALLFIAEESAGVLKQLRKMGVSVALDDFGTGYSSLSYLRRFPIDKLKIDRSFIRDVTISRTDESIVRAIVSLARSVGLRVVAEGIESAEQLEFVTRLECDQWQGYHCCPPQTAACFQAMLVDRTGTRTGLAAALAALVTRGTDT
jgi:hypothetical protein